MDDKLLPCPFCGSENIVTTDFGASTWFVQCDDCGATFPRFDTETEAIAAWNRRADAVPVVRCKECEYYNTTGCSKGFGWCENMDMGVSDDFYCANGAKITNKETGETYK